MLLESVPKPPLLLAFFSLILIVTVAASLMTRAPEPRFHGKLEQILPESPQGWTQTHKPVAETEEMKKAVTELLNYDDGIFIEYTKGNDHLSLYLAYWKPGKMSYRLVSAHTPDVCWPANGWHCLSATKGSVYPTLDGVSLPPAEVRVFQGSRGPVEHVWFWHVAGNKVISYGTQSDAPWYAMFQDLLTDGLNLRCEQFFIRLSSNLPLDDPSLAPLMNRLTARILPTVSPPGGLKP